MGGMEVGWEQTLVSTRELHLNSFLHSWSMEFEEAKLIAFRICININIASISLGIKAA